MADAGEEIGEDGVLADEEDIEHHGRQGTKPRHARRYRFILDGSEHRVHQHSMTAIAILDLVAKDPGEWILEKELHGGHREVLEPDDVVVFHHHGIVAFHTRKRHHDHHGHDVPFTLEIVVTGTPVRVETTQETLLSKIVSEALILAEAVGRPDTDWLLKNAEGVVFDQSLTVHAAGIKNGATLYLSLTTGAAGDMSGLDLPVDPAVSRAKFDEELERYRAVEDGLIRRGQWLVTAKFPEVFAVFAAAPNTLPHLVAFGATLEFTNYDLQPPSVRIVNPFTRVPYKWEELPHWARLERKVPPAQLVINGMTQIVAANQTMMQPSLSGSAPFLCIPGTREYHAHPAHTGDSWLLRRSRGEGTLYHLLDVLYQYGAVPIKGMAVQMIVATEVSPL